MLGQQRRGLSSIYMFFVLVAMTLFCSMGVDYGRIQVAKMELQRVADAAARAGAAAIPLGVAEARAEAIRWAVLNTVGGQPLVLTDADVFVGKWDSSTKTLDTSSFTPDTVRVMAKRISQRGTGMPLLWASVFGQKALDVHAKSSARYQDEVNVNVTSMATANPFLAGMPAGSVASMNNPHNSPDYAGTAAVPRQSPFAITTLPLVAGMPITFDSISGTARHDPNLADYQPDGQLNSIGHNTNGSENGIRDITCPINALVAVFLDNSDPTSTAVPTIDPANAPSDYSTAAARDRAVYRPALKQIFFVGDGLTSSGGHQQFIVPEGATRLFLATWDFYEWNNNSGYRTVKINRPGRVVTVE